MSVKMEEYLLNFLRNNVTDPSSRGTDTTETFSGDDNETSFELTNAQVKNIGTIAVGGVTQYWGEHYTVSFGEGSTGKTTITFTTAPATGADNISIPYHYGQSLVYKGYARDDITPPRIMLNEISETDEDVGAGDNWDGTNGEAYNIILFDALVISLYAKDCKQLSESIKSKVHWWAHQPDHNKREMVEVVSSRNFDWNPETKWYERVVTIRIREREVF